MTADVVRTAAEAGERPPLLILDRLEAFLDGHGLGSGPVRPTRIGEGGGSNFTFAEGDFYRTVQKSPDRYVMRSWPKSRVTVPSSTNRRAS